MKSISLCMIVKDEEEVLERCLKSIHDIVDEIVLVDTGSEDNTKKIGEKFNCKIYDFKWIDSFAAARNYSFEKATKQYILWLDADDILLEEDRIKLLKLKEEDTDADAYSMIYNYAFDENNNVILSLRRNRLVKAQKNYKWIGAVHEYLDVNGKVTDLNICITHRKIKISGDRNLKIYNKRLKKGEEFNSRDQYYYAKELYDNELYELTIKEFEKFLKYKNAWFEDKIRACEKIALSYRYLGDNKKSRRACYQSFEYDSPRPEICCLLGNIYLNENKLNQAAFWYEVAYNNYKDNNWSYVNKSSYTWLPHLQLCYIYSRLNNMDKAYYHHKLAQNYNPKHESIKYNEVYFKSIGYDA